MSFIEPTREAREKLSSARISRFLRRWGLLGRKASLEGAPADHSRGHAAAALFGGNTLALLSLFILAGYAVLALFAPLIFPGNPQDLAGPPLLQPGVNPAFPLGTDMLGRDIAAGIVHGARTSLVIGLSAVAVGTGLGVSIGLAAGYFGGFVEDVLMRISEIMETLPNIVVLVVMVAILVPSMLTIAAIIGALSWAPLARVVRAEVRSLREKEFVAAARSLGLGNLHIMMREILPNALPSVIVMSSMMVASAILTESTVSFIGLGDPNSISWGMMISAGKDMLRTAPHITAVPGIAILVCVLALNILGDRLNDVLNPRHSVDR